MERQPVNRQKELLERQRIILKLERRVVKNDTQAFNQLLGLYSHDIFIYLVKRTGEEDAEDLAQEVMARAIDSYRGRFKNQGYSLKVLLYRMAHNLLIDHYRTSRPVVPLEDIEEILPSKSDDLPFEQAAKNLDRQELMRAIGKLTIDQQTILQLRYLDGYKMNEVAEIMNKTPETTWALHYRALQAMQRVNPNLLKQLNCF